MVDPDRVSTASTSFSVRDYGSALSQLADQAGHHAALNRLVAEYCTGSKWHGRTSEFLNALDEVGEGWVVPSEGASGDLEFLFSKGESGGSEGESPVPTPQSTTPPTTLTPPPPPSRDSPLTLSTKSVLIYNQALVLYQNGHPSDALNLLSPLLIPSDIIPDPYISLRASLLAAECALATHQPVDEYVATLTERWAEESKVPVKKEGGRPTIWDVAGNTGWPNMTWTAAELTIRGLIDAKKMVEARKVLEKHLAGKTWDQLDEPLTSSIPTETPPPPEKHQKRRKNPSAAKDVSSHDDTRRSLAKTLYELSARYLAAHLAFHLDAPSTALSTLQPLQLLTTRLKAMYPPADPHPHLLDAYYWNAVGCLSTKAGKHALAAVYFGRALCGVETVFREEQGVGLLDFDGSVAVARQEDEEEEEEEMEEWERVAQEEEMRERGSLVVPSHPQPHHHHHRHTHTHTKPPTHQKPTTTPHPPLPNPSPSLSHNAGTQLLHLGNPSAAFPCFLQSLQLLTPHLSPSTNNDSPATDGGYPVPRALSWLRLGESCLGQLHTSSPTRKIPVGGYTLTVPTHSHHPPRQDLLAMALRAYTHAHLLLSPPSTPVPADEYVHATLGLVYTLLAMGQSEVARNIGSEALHAWESIAELDWARDVLEGYNISS